MPDLTDLIAHRYLDVLEGVTRACDNADVAALGRAIEVLDSVRRKRSRVYLIGNGGSASVASHMACDLAKTVGHGGGEGLRAMALGDNSPLMTAWSNDVGAVEVFSGQLAVLLDPEDVVVAISVSGNSENIVAGLKIARSMGATTMALLGADGGKALSLADFPMVVPCDDFGIVETVHVGLMHAITAGLRAAQGLPPLSCRGDA